MSSSKLEHAEFGTSVLNFELSQKQQLGSHFSTKPNTNHPVSQGKRSLVGLSMNLGGNV